MADNGREQRAAKRNEGWEASRLEIEEKKLQGVTMELYLLFWFMIERFFSQMDQLTFVTMLTNGLDWVAANHFFNVEVVNALKSFLPLLPWASISACLYVWAARFQVVAPDGLPSNPIMRAIFPKLKEWVKQMNQKTIKGLIATMNKYLKPQGARAEPGAQSQSSPRRRRMWPKKTLLAKNHEPASNSAVKVSIRFWNETHGSSSTKGTKRKTIVPRECGRVYKKSKNLH